MTTTWRLFLETIRRSTLKLEHPPAGTKNHGKPNGADYTVLWTYPKKKVNLLDFLCMKQSYPKSDETDIQTVRTG